MFSNWVDNLFLLSNQIHGLKEKISSNSNIDIEAPDARLVALSGMQESVLHCGFWLNIYSSIVHIHGNENSILEYAGSNLDLEKTSNILIKELRLGLPIFFHFKLENFLNCIWRKITNKEPEGITATYEELCKVVGIKNLPKKVKVIRSFSSIRNSLHNNGIHKHRGFSIKIGNINYEFEKDKVVQCSSLDHIINLLLEIIRLLYEIIETEEVKKINEIIPDKFSNWLIAEKSNN